MADTYLQVHELNELTTAESTDMVPVEDSSESELKYITPSNLLDSMLTLLANDAITWEQVNKTGSDLDDLATKNALDLQATGPDVLLGRESAGTGDVESIPCTAFARTLLDDADAATARATLGADVTSEDLIAMDEGWFELPAENYTADHALLEEYDGSTVNSVTAWQAGTVYGLGDFVKPTYAYSGSYGYIWECTVAGISDIVEPTWPELVSTIDTDTVDNTVTWTARSLHIIEMLVDLTDTYDAGMPVKIVHDLPVSKTLFGIILKLTATRLVIKCNGFLNWTDFTLYIGSRDRVRDYIFTVKDEYIDGNYYPILYFVGGSPIWNLSQGYLVDFKFKHRINVTSGNAATITPSIDGYAIDSYASITTSFQRLYSSFTNFRTVINFGTEFDVMVNGVAVPSTTAKNFMCIFTFVVTGGGINPYYW